MTSGMTGHRLTFRGRVVKSVRCELVNVSIGVGSDALLEHKMNAPTGPASIRVLYCMRPSTATASTFAWARPWSAFESMCGPLIESRKP